MKALLGLFSVLILITGCSTKQYFEPEDTLNFEQNSKNLPASIISFNKDGASLENGSIISVRGISKTKIKEGYTFLNNSENGIISSNNKDSILIGDKVINLGSVIVAASIKNDILALVHSDNSVSAYDLRSSKTLFKEYSSKSYINDIRIANPFFMSNIILFPTLDGKVLIVSSQNYKIIRSVNVDTSGKFNNIIYLNVVNDTLIAASSNKVVSVGDGVLNVKNYELRDIISHNNDIYLATIDGQIIKTDISLNVQDRKKYKFAKFYALAFGTSLYALESQGYIIKISEDFKTDSIYDFSFGEEDNVISIKDTLYIEDEYIKLK